MDVTGQSGSTTPANGNGRHGEGYPANGWGDSWSGAGSALEPEPDSVVPAWRRGMDALGPPRAQTPPRYAEILADAGVRPPAQAQPGLEPPDDHRLFEAPGIDDPPEFIPLPHDGFDGLPDDDLLGTDPLGGPFGPFVSGALNEDTPPQGTPSPFARLLDIPSVPSAPPAPRASTYPVQAPPVVPPTGNAAPLPPYPDQPAYQPPAAPSSMAPPTAQSSAAPPVSRPPAAPDPAYQTSAPPLWDAVDPTTKARPSQAPISPAAGSPAPVSGAPGWPAPVSQASVAPTVPPPVHQGPPPAPPGLRPAAHMDASATIAPVSGPAYLRRGTQPGTYGRPPAPPGEPCIPTATHGGPAILRPAAPERHSAYGYRERGEPVERTHGEPAVQEQDRRAPRAPLEPGYEEPELETQVAEVEPQQRTDHAHGLPKRVPAEPDVPGLAEPPATEPPAPAPVLSRVASGLRRDDLPPAERPDAFDVAAVLSAVRDVPGVRDAQLRATATGGHTLRLDLADGSDPAYVSRVVARMLNERMGLIAEPPGGRPSEPPPEPEPPRPAPTVPLQGGGQAQISAYQDEPPTGRVPVPSAQRSGPPLPPGLVPASAAPREPRRRHPVTMRGRYPAELRPGGLSSNDRIETEPGRPPALTPPTDARRAVLDHVQVSTFGLDATVEVRLVLGERVALGVANGPAVDGYILRLSAAAAANAVDELLGEAAEGSSGRGHCYVEQAAIVPLGSCEVAVVVVLLVCDGWVEQLAGSALVAGDPRQAVVRATLAAVNRRLTALLP